MASQVSPPGMIKDLIRLTVQRVMRDKILLGLVIIGVLGIFVGGFAPGKEDRTQPKIAAAEKSTSPPPSDYSANEALNAGLAVDFVKWWVSEVMDYGASTAIKSHSDAFQWMTPDAEQAFEATFWTPQLANGIASGKTVGAFQPVSIQPAAINPDGSVVVTITGTLVLHSVGRPTTQQILTDVLVRRGPSGLRICGLYNHSPAAVSSTVY